LNEPKKLNLLIFRTGGSIKDLYSSRSNANWLIFGDFNLILNSSEKFGGNGLDINLFACFNETLNYCDLIDLGYQGNIYTWANNQSGSHHIKERLDRFCVNSNWIQSFPRYNNKYLLRYTSDHCPIFLEFYDVNESRSTYNTPRLKRFEQLWAQDQECTQIVKNMWKYSSDDSIHKLQFTMESLFEWGKSKFGELPKEIKKHSEVPQPA
jgi:hypothetical protein